MGRVWGQMWKRSGGSEWTREKACGGGLPANCYSSFPPKPRCRPLGGCCPSTSLSSAKGVSVVAPGAECCLGTVPRTSENGVGSAGDPLDPGQGLARHRASGNAGLRLASGWTSSRGPAAPAICLHPQLQVGGTSVPGRCCLATLALPENQMGAVWRGMQETEQRGAQGRPGRGCCTRWGGGDALEGLQGPGCRQAAAIPRAVGMEGGGNPVLPCGVGPGRGRRGSGLGGALRPGVGFTACGGHGRESSGGSHPSFRPVSITGRAPQAGSDSDAPRPWDIVP